MHTSNYDGVTFHYNGDFSGEINITKGDEEITVPASSLLKLVGYDYVMPTRVAQLQNKNHIEILLSNY